MSDRLLEWLSFRGAGRADDLPADETAGQPRRILANLSALGHVEVLDRAAWRVAPPTLALLPRECEDDAAAILCGARTPGVLAQLHLASERTGARIRTAEQPARPSLIRVAAPSPAALSETAAAAGMRFQPDAAYTLLACIPSLADWPRTPCEMVAGRVATVKRFSGSRAQWVASSPSEAQQARRGFFRIRRDYDWVSIIKSGKDSCAYIDDRAGRMLAATKLRHLAWSADTRAFSLPIHLYPPALITRALVLCSGVMPEYDRANGRILFSGIGREMLRLVISITGLRLA